ncbi:hypothetical protein [Mycolicibacterium fluoranthenivorans]|uniref:Uncharacterized protein n=1 Tax=Mycolicibacterium fluoranthenivorans TaxID=258505 RepID=A0A7X5ZCR0_9MYCO|nr:hypothetical protein [Mycolicibacterium fluoranthenivorans]MCV7357300.1 hypothetical protein [Mycolicibacterium fluoranthenivorans]NIH95321.1 hypothetical protein [Mycolicibacterium fluoranthenivorans]
MNTDDVRAGTVWVRGLLAGAILGGIGWGLFAALTVGARGDQSHLNAVFGRYLTGAAGISLTCLAISGFLARIRHLCTPAVALAVAPVSGWLFLGLQYLQSLVLR